jgi:hypothetical protein
MANLAVMGLCRSDTTREHTQNCAGPRPLGDTISRGDCTFYAQKPIGFFDFLTSPPISIASIMTPRVDSFPAE